MSTEPIDPDGDPEMVQSKAKQQPDRAEGEDEADETS
jgi:hypothetical protein